MQIIIVGCGKVGSTLAEQLQEEDTDITLIDINPDRINEITDEVDAMGVVGNGASINFKTSAFSIRHKDRYFCQRQGRTSEI